MIDVELVPVQSFVYSVKRIGDRTESCGQLVEIKWEDESTAW